MVLEDLQIFRWQFVELCAENKAIDQKLNDIWWWMESNNGRKSPYKSIYIANVFFIQKKGKNVEIPGAFTPFLNGIIKRNDGPPLNNNDNKNERKKNERKTKNVQ